MKVFLTGASGFIGRKLVYRLIDDGNDVAVLVRPESRLIMLNEILPRIRVHVYDGTYGSLFHALKKENPELVIHLASLFLAQHKPEEIKEIIESNVTFPNHLLEAMSQLGIKYLINTGTSWQHYNEEIYNPVNLYAATKQAFESLLTYYAQSVDLKVITLKLFDTYGPDDTRPKLFNILRSAAKTGDVLKMSPGNQLLDLLYIDDVLDAYVLAMTYVSKITRPVSYAVSNPIRISLRELVCIYMSVINQPINVEWGGLPYRPREVMVPWLSGPTVPMWYPKVLIRDGIERMERKTG